MKILDFEDHMGGFNSNLHNDILDSIDTDSETIVVTEYILDQTVKNNYKNIKFQFNLNFKQRLFNTLSDYANSDSAKINYKNFVCSFNGSRHVSRELLVSALHTFGYFNSAYCSKNFISSIDVIDGHIFRYVSDNDRFYRKFILNDDSNKFLQTVNSFGRGHFNNDFKTIFDHRSNVYNLESKLTESFLHIVSETVATSYVPFVTEKFLYSILTRGLFLSYAQPGWHAHIEKYYGFKLYTNLFDYRFDTIQNPIERLVELMTMVSKFSKLSFSDLYDLYLLELDTINFNYDHYFSKNYLKILSTNEQ